MLIHSQSSGKPSDEMVVLAHISRCSPKSSCAIKSLHLKYLAWSLQLYTESHKWGSSCCLARLFIKTGWQWEVKCFASSLAARRLASPGTSVSNPALVGLRVSGGQSSENQICALKDLFIPPATGIGL